MKVGMKEAAKMAFHCLGVEGVLKIVLKRRGRARREVPQQPDQQSGVDRPMPRQALKVLQRMRCGPVFGADVVKHASGPPLDGDRGHDSSADEK